MNLQPLEDRIVVRPAEAEETTISGLVIPDTAKEKPQQGEVLAVGPGRRAENSGELIAMELSPGDTVVYSKYGGTEITVDGEDVLILSSRDVLAKVGARPRRSSSRANRVSNGRPRGPPVRRCGCDRATCAGQRPAPWPTCSRPCRSGPRTISGTNTNWRGRLKRASESSAAARSVAVTVASSAAGDDRGDGFAEPVVGDADHEAVGDAGVQLHRFLDLFGEHLLAAGVDHDRAAAEQRRSSRRLRRGPSRRAPTSAGR